MDSPKVSVPLDMLLSERELQTFKALGAGKTVSEIARELGLSVKTVSTYNVRIMHKLRLTRPREVCCAAVALFGVKEALSKVGASVDSVAA
jgi:DNA-binding NarL/FixJ family response regulator